MPAVSAYSLSGQASIDGILGDRKWAVNSLTYSFPSQASSYGSSYGDGEPYSGFAALNAGQRDYVRCALDMFASVSNLTFSEVQETSSRSGDLRFAMSSVPSTAWAYFPSSHASGGDAWFNSTTGYYDAPQLGNYGALTFVHEIGHALGLEHAHENIVMPAAYDSMANTVMSYRSYTGAALTGGYTNERWGYAQSLMMLDIAALQHVYGANYAFRSGDTRYAWNPNTGEMSVDGIGQGASGANRVFQTVWDGGGNDTYDFSGYRTGVTVSLKPGEWSVSSQAQLARVHYSGSQLAPGNIANALLYKGQAQSLIENAIGGTGNDTLTGNQAANALLGGDGADTLNGGAGNDVLDGGAGSDTAIFSGRGSDYEVERLANGTSQISDLRTGAPDGQDIAWNVEWLRFTDGFCRMEDALSGVAPRLVEAVVTEPAPVTAVPVGVRLAGAAGADRLYGTALQDSLAGGSGNDILLGGTGADRLDGGSGIDWASFSTAKDGVVADLLRGGGYRNDSAGDIYLRIENILGGTGHDSLRGDNRVNILRGGAGNDQLIGRGGSDVIDGGAGNDVIHGGAGRDVLVGGSGRDVFVFQSIGESRGSARDVIKDFTRGSDRIDLRAIDADTTSTFNQAFTFIGKAAFSGRAGELKFSGGVIAGDVNGDGIADFQVTAARVSTLTKGDFLL